eukprot:3840342-Rhodomonas_salina.1
MLTMSQPDEKSLEKTLVNLHNLFHAFQEYTLCLLSDLRDEVNNRETSDQYEHDALQRDLDTVKGIVKSLKECHENMCEGHGVAKLNGLWKTLLDYEKVYGVLSIKYEEFEAPEEDDGKGGGGMLRLGLVNGGVGGHSVGVVLHDFEEEYMRDMLEDLRYYVDGVLEALKGGALVSWDECCKLEREYGKLVEKYNA